MFHHATRGEAVIQPGKRRGLPWDKRLRCGWTIRATRFASLRSGRRTPRKREGFRRFAVVLDGASREEESAATRAASEGKPQNLELMWSLR
jgi:hypothetical protein